MQHESNDRWPGIGSFPRVERGNTMSDSIISTPTMTGIVDGRDDRGRDLFAVLQNQASTDRHNGELHLLRELSETRRDVQERQSDLKDKLSDMRKEMSDVRNDMKDMFRNEIGAVKDLIKDLDRDRIKDELQLLKLQACVAAPVCVAQR